MRAKVARGRWIPARACGVLACPSGRLQVIAAPCSPTYTVVPLAKGDSLFRAHTRSRWMALPTLFLAAPDRHFIEPAMLHFASAWAHEYAVESTYTCVCCSCYEHVAAPSRWDVMTRVRVQRAGLGATHRLGCESAAVTTDFGLLEIAAVPVLCGPLRPLGAEAHGATDGRAALSDAVSRAAFSRSMVDIGRSTSVVSAGNGNGGTYTRLCIERFNERGSPGDGT